MKGSRGKVLYFGSDLNYDVQATREFNSKMSEEGVESSWDTIAFVPELGKSGKY
jgi:hypothetical protein